MLFGCVLWGHVFGVHCSLREVAHGNAGKLVVLYCSALCWAVAAPTHTYSAALYLLNHTIPLHGLITKQMTRYFGQVEGGRQRFVQSQDAGIEGYVQQSCWVLHFVHTALQEVENHSGGCCHCSPAATVRKQWCQATSAIEGWKLLCTANELDTHSTF